MIAKSTAFLVAALTMSGQIHTEARNQAAQGIQVVGVDAAPPDRQGAIRIQAILKNISPLTITAYNYSIRFHYADGTERSSGGGWDSIAEFLANPNADSLFHPNTTKSIDTSLRISPSGEGLTITAEVTAIVLDDDTVVGNSELIPGFEASRRRLLQQTATILGDLKDVKSSPSPKQRAVDLASKVRREDPNFGGRAAILTVVSAELDKSNDGLDKAISLYEAMISSLKAHSTLTEAK